MDSSSNPMASSSNPMASSSNPMASSSNPMALSSNPMASSSNPMASSISPFRALLGWLHFFILTPFMSLWDGSISYIKKMIGRGGAARVTVASQRIERMIKKRDACGNTVVESDIEASKDHWSETSKWTRDEEGNMVANEDEEGNMVRNEETFARLKEEWGGFFQDYGDDLVIGDKFAEGGQAEIFRAEWTHSDGNVENCVAKIFKEGWALDDLEKQWPEGMLKKANTGGYYSSNSCQIYGGLLLKNGRFGFLMEAHNCDLRKLIDDLMIFNGNKPECSPLNPILDQGHALVSIAWGMWALHEHNIIHRDLKASNVLFKFNGPNLKFKRGSRDISAGCVISDFECSVGVVGTGYWRAPEILHALKIHDIKPNLFTKEADVYSFSMTCYEILTGRIPFENLGGQDYDNVLNGERPTLPKGIDPRLKALLEKCWHSNPLERPSFKYILELLRIYPRLKDV